MTASTPMRAPTVSAVRWLSPVSRVTDRPWSWRAATASAEVAFTRSATTNTASAVPDRPASTAVDPVASASAAAASTAGGT